MTGDTVLYVWGCYVAGIALVLMEIALLRLRYNSIRGHLGWSWRYRRPAALPPTGVDSFGRGPMA